ncbi:MAG: DUF3990 domain-containing protein [Oscillospiraceae bacterium]|jgi:hypothetical protein|nr:DUF3990 domain-containing protein [Oscillospiraceae bacterium]
MSDGVITLYHGSIYKFDAIDVTRGKPNKDFGRGFYTSRTERHAVGIATRNRAIALERARQAGRSRSVDAWVYSYAFDLRELKNLNVKEFTDAGREWAMFVAENRKNRGTRHGYDVVIGNTANDDTNTTVELFVMGAYGDVNSDEAIDTFLRLILPERLPPQMYFGTQKAAALLTPTGRRKI